MELIDDRSQDSRYSPLFCRDRVNAFAWGEARKVNGKLYAVNVTRLDDVDINELIVRLSPISMGGTITSNQHRAETLIFDLLLAPSGINREIPYTDLSE